MQTSPIFTTENRIAASRLITTRASTEASKRIVRPGIEVHPGRKIQRRRSKDGGISKSLKIKKEGITGLDRYILR